MPNRHLKLFVTSYTGNPIEANEIPKPDEAAIWLQLNHRYVVGTPHETFDKVKKRIRQLGLTQQGEVVQSEENRLFLITEHTNRLATMFDSQIMLSVGSHRIALLDPSLAFELSKMATDFSISPLPRQMALRQHADLTRFVGQEDQGIRDVIGLVSRQRLESIVRRLSSYRTRGATTSGYRQAAVAVESSLSDLGWDWHRGREYRAHGGKSFNIVAEKRGTLSHQERQLYYLTAHLDTSNEPDPDPGADDNASGCAALLEIARILGNRQLRHDVRLAFFGAEESGVSGGYQGRMATIGSKVHVDRIPPLERRRVQGALNLDMIAYSAGRDHTVAVDGHALSTNPLKEQLCRTGATYFADQLKVELVKGTYPSDHWVFILEMLPAVALTEGGERLPFPHTSYDKASILDFGLASKITAMALAWLLEQAL